MVGKKIKELRLNRKMTQEELGKIIGVTTSMIGMYETGARNPSYAVLNKIAEYFNVTTDYLLGLEEKEDAETRAIARAFKNLSSKKRELLFKLAESMAEEAEKDKNGKN
ncbi:MAG TPA: helix-turn-helix transcriptional regulator [Thermoanaerobacterales bacterium]|nr:helix-turn-helix transcriptional regulator [Thermoanaerobacterales bacterium]